MIWTFVPLTMNFDVNKCPELYWSYLFSTIGSNRNTWPPENNAETSYSSNSKWSDWPLCCSWRENKIPKINAERKRTRHKRDCGKHTRRTYDMEANRCQKLIPQLWTFGRPVMKNLVWTTVSWLDAKWNWPTFFFDFTDSRCRSVCSPIDWLPHNSLPMNE